MKLILRRCRIAIAFGCLSLSLNSCKKQVTDDPITEKSIAPAAITAAAACKPVILGVMIEYPNNGPAYWRTLMQKWYGADGKLAYLKADFYWSNEDYINLYSEVRWAKVIYHNNNQVFLDEGLGTYRLRVTIDEQKRPVASYYFRDGGPRGPMGNYTIDTSYYHFTGDRLDSILNIHVSYYGGPPDFYKYKFFYDTYGNLVEVQTTIAQGTYSRYLSYDYAVPVTDMLWVHEMGIPYTLMEYMDLLHFPIHHKLIQANQQYSNHMMQDNGLIYSYNRPGLIKKTYYTGWDCGTGTPLRPSTRQTSPNSLEEFQRLYTQPGK
jgi:hypothetical protein